MTAIALSSNPLKPATPTPKSMIMAAPAAAFSPLARYDGAPACAVLGFGRKSARYRRIRLLERAPFADPTVTRPTLPQAVWFFCVAANYLPFPRRGPALSWFVGTVDARQPRALAIAPLTLPVLLLNQIAPLRRHIWPWVQSRLSISHAPLTRPLDEWHDYRLDWRKRLCVLRRRYAGFSYTRTLTWAAFGFVCWIDNQYLIVTPRGRLGYGVVPLPTQQWLEVRGWNSAESTPLDAHCTLPIPSEHHLTNFDMAQSPCYTPTSKAIWRNGRVDYGGCLENNCSKLPGFESSSSALD